ncbi:MAG TPA: FKBP-type peptidyl-prolyl cis-trans isomerase [Chitinophagales bacterium]|nr:FKBP-type peptidyl-prolyl cis-trans isomerase [Chitinophagales bacterium]HNM31695.1 FKBP-type peptidyl-prolyl cis-trans isomerase [Chitinophagales bacterium]
MNKHILTTVIAAAAVLIMTSCNSKSDFSKATPKKEIDSVSYAIGVQMGENLKQNGLDSTINLEIMARGIFEALNNKKTLFGGDTLNFVLMKHFNPQMYAALKANEEKSKKFFEENGKKAGVKTTASGLQYEVITEGTGPKPKLTDMVKVDYTGTLLDGTVFDSSVKKGPATFPLNGVIPGWSEGLQLMSVGSKYKLYIPGKLAYGMQGQQQAGIGPDETLVFEVELKGIEAPKPNDNNAAMQKMLEEAIKKQQGKAK